MNYAKKILAATVIAGMLPVAAVAFGPLTVSTLQSNAEMLSAASPGVKSFLQIVEAETKRTSADGTGSTTDGVIHLGLDTAAGLVAVYTTGSAPTVTLTPSATTGGILTGASDSVLWTGAADIGGVYSWTCTITAVNASVEVNGVSASEAIDAVTAMSTGVFRGCTS